MQDHGRPRRSQRRRGARSPTTCPAGSATPVSKAARNPELLLYKLKNNAYKFSWALIPLSVPFVWLLFPFSRRFRLYDHMVFVTYSLAFMTLAGGRRRAVRGGRGARRAGLLMSCRRSTCIAS